ncbi:DUF58 domain-containing protein [Bacteriovorax sp. DB6_IX]|uniref:DUF58 domain-containing protein n=1 Tax=Bacteriovorax sp. DB6_IX TaxID=1353530 RepID=UPI0018E00D95|nr:DUF58 domain-containing protein [Bacteriovorax sp. DB6_IX]
MQKLRHRLRNKQLAGNRVYIIPSRFGLLYLMILSFSIILAVSFGHAFSYYLSALLFVLFIIAAFMSNSYMKNLEIQIVEGDYLVSQSQDYGVKFHAHAIDDPSLSFILEYQSGNKKSSKEVLIHEKKSLFTFYYNFFHWGVKKYLRMKVSSSYPFFLFTTWKYLKCEEEFIIYPKVSKRSFNRHKDTSQKEYDDIELRAYIQGEPLSRVHWKKYAQTSQLIVKTELGGESDINLIDENLLNKIDKEIAVGIICHEIQEHIRKSKSFAYLSREKHFRIVSRPKHMMDIARSLIHEIE